MKYFCVTLIFTLIAVSSAADVANIQRKAQGKIVSVGVKSSGTMEGTNSGLMRKTARGSLNSTASVNTTWCQSPVWSTKGTSNPVVPPLAHCYDGFVERGSGGVPHDVEFEIPSSMLSEPAEVVYYGFTHGTCVEVTKQSYSCNGEKIGYALDSSDKWHSRKGYGTGIGSLPAEPFTKEECVEECKRTRGCDLVAWSSAGYCFPYHTQDCQEQAQTGSELVKVCEPPASLGTNRKVHIEFMGCGSSGFNAPSTVQGSDPWIVTDESGNKLTLTGANGGTLQEKAEECAAKCDEHNGYVAFSVQKEAPTSQILRCVCKKTIPSVSFTDQPADQCHQKSVDDIVYQFFDKNKGSKWIAKSYDRTSQKLKMVQFMFWMQNNQPCMKRLEARFKDGTFTAEDGDTTTDKEVREAWDDSSPTDERETYQIKNVEIQTCTIAS